jgi:hypothetical protein
MINSLSEQFSLRTESAQKKAFADMLLEPVMNVDFTSVNVNGKKVNLTVCATPSGVLYFVTENKGHKGVDGTPIKDYYGILVHDHEITFYSYGDSHQECLDHIIRYLKCSTSNEAELKWNIQMLDLVREMIHFRKWLDPNDERDPDEIAPEKVEEFERRYDEILELARREYEYEPPTKYYMKGFNLQVRLGKYKAEHLLFLHDRRVSYSNSLVERRIRLVKRKEHQVMVFRSIGGVKGFCNALGVIETLRSKGNNLYESVSLIFSTPLIVSGDSVS